jgi:ankyrin repeat protein
VSDSVNHNIFFPIASGQTVEVRRILDEILSQKNDPAQGKDIIDSWPLHFALMNCKTNLPEMIGLLVSYGADPNNCTHMNPETSALMLAIAQNLDQNVVRALMDNGANINKQIWNGRTALHTAAQSGNTHMTRFLLEQGARADFRDNNGSTAKDVVVERHGESSAIALMLQAIQEADEMDNLVSQPIPTDPAADPMAKIRQRKI